MTNVPALAEKRGAIGFFAVVCLIGSLVLMNFPGHEGLQGALVRVGVLLAAFWLVLGRPPKWKRLSSNWVIFSGIVGAILLPRARAMFPVLAVIIGIALFARPRKKAAPASEERPHSEQAEQ